MRVRSFVGICLLVVGCSNPIEEPAANVVATSVPLTIPQQSSTTSTTVQRTTPEDFLSADTKMCPSGVVAFVFADCPSLLPLETGEIRLTPEDAALIEELRKSAGDDINKQITAAQEIQNVVNRYSGELDVTLCGAMQGRSNGTFRVTASRSENKARIAELIETTCPGNLDLLIG